MTPYSTRYWFFDGSLDTWQSREGLSLTVGMQKAADPRVPPTVTEIDGFAERSVAATDWQLIIPTISLGVQVLDVNELNDIELYFFHYTVDRP